MSSEGPIVNVESLGKRYEIYAKPADRLKQMLLPRLYRVLGRGERAYFREFWAVNDVSFHVRRGETLGIIGRNGSGKSTILQMICGTIHPTTGRVRTEGRVAALLELGAGFNPEFSGRENIFLSGLLYGISDKVLKERYQSILDFAEIGDFIEQPVKTYSSGMYVRLAFAIAAHVDADVLIIDEALSVGDVQFTQKCMRYLRDFQTRGTLIFVSHDTGAVVNLCDRAIWMESGRLQMDGDTREVVETYLAEQHAADRSRSGHAVKVGQSSQKSSDGGTGGASNRATTDVVDSRQDRLNGRGCRNLVEVFEFDESRAGKEFGVGDARITHVGLVDEAGQPTELTLGGELVELVISADVLRPVESPIVGFYVKDRLGQRLFGDNTYVTYHDQPLSLEEGQQLTARFRFRMPVLPNGDYSVDVALASGTQDDHTHQHWLHDAISFKASESTMRSGLVGIPMLSIRLDAETHA